MRTGVLLLKVFSFCCLLNYHLLSVTFFHSLRIWASFSLMI
uniref:Uncharacterized protein n=1 Tax=Rhizophora mucronata TaxID=61149 RepID=A0A2P2JBV8_RHIMU